MVQAQRGSITTEDPFGPEPYISNQINNAKKLLGIKNVLNILSIRLLYFL